MKNLSSSSINAITNGKGLRILRPQPQVPKILNLQFKCKKCEGSFRQYVRKRKNKNGVVRISKSSYCFICHWEDQRVRDSRIYEWKLAYNRAWRKANRKKVNEYARRDYAKRKFDINLIRRLRYHPIPRKVAPRPQPWKFRKKKWAPLIWGKGHALADRKARIIKEVTYEAK